MQTLDNVAHNKGERAYAGEGWARASAVTRRIWGSREAILLVFVGAAAEFAVNKANDWLFHTNALPSAPIQRFFETVRFAQEMVFGDERTRARAVAAVNGAHRVVERSRGDRIPQWAHRDVLFMLIDYGERAHRMLFGPMTLEERLAHFAESVQIGRELRIEGLPETYSEYRRQRREHLLANTARTRYTGLLYESYRRNLGPLRMWALLELQGALTPAHVRRLLDLRPTHLARLLVRVYRYLLTSGLVRLFTPVILPARYAPPLAQLDTALAFR